MTNQARRNRKGSGGYFSERKTRVKKKKDRLTSRSVHTAQETGAHLGNIRSRSITRQLKSQRNKK